MFEVVLFPASFAKTLRTNDILGDVRRQKSTFPRFDGRHSNQGWTPWPTSRPPWPGSRPALSSKDSAGYVLQGGLGGQPARGIPDYGRGDKRDLSPNENRQSFGSVTRLVVLPHSFARRRKSHRRNVIPRQRWRTKRQGHPATPMAPFCVGVPPGPRNAGLRFRLGQKPRDIGGRSGK